MSSMNEANQMQGVHRKARYDAYRNSERREVNKAKKIVRHLKAHPFSKDALAALTKLTFTARKRAGVGEFFDTITRQSKQKGYYLTTA